MSDSIYEVTPMRCPQCRGTEFLVEEEAEFRISGNEVSEVTCLDINRTTQVSCEDCDFRGQAWLFNPGLQDGMTKEKLLEILDSVLKRKSPDGLCDLATKLLGLHISFTTSTNDDDKEEHIFVILEKDRKEKKK